MADGVLYFTVQGDTITELAREKYKETNDISIGVEFLKGCLIGFPNDLATAIVLGNKKLVGVNEVFVEDDCAEVEPYGIIKPSAPEDVVCGWISPDGQIFGHRSYNEQNDHHVLAIEICKRLAVESFNEEWDLEKLGYLKFQPTRCMAGDHPAKMSQKLALADICKAHGLRMQIGWNNPYVFSGADIEAMDLIMFNKHLGR